VDLATSGPKVSRIRRNPPAPPPKKVTPGELRQHEAKVILVGLIAAGLAIALILVQIANWAGWSPSNYHLIIRQGD
jgi:hypothetical protein